MKILQLTNKAPYPARDGGSIASLALAVGLTREGHEVTVLAMNTSKHHVTSQRSGDLKIRFELVPVDTRIRWFEALVNLLFSKLPYNAVRFDSKLYRQRLWELLTQEKYDLILLENLYTALYLDDIEKLCNAMIIMRAHNVEHEIWERTAASAEGLKKAYLYVLARRIKRFERSMMNRYDALVPITERDAGKFRSMGNQKPVHVLQTGIDTSQPVHNLEFSGRPAVAHLGALDWLPNQDGIRWFMKEVWPLVVKKIPGLEFHLAGRNAPADFASEMTSAGAIFHGEIEDAGQFIRSHPVFVVPLFSGSGMRIKLLEYLAAGRAVVTTGIGAEGIPVHHGQEVLMTNSALDFAGYIVTLLMDPQKGSEIGKNAITFVEKNYNNQVLIRNFTGFLKKLRNDSQDTTLD